MYSLHGLNSYHKIVYFFIFLVQLVQSTLLDLIMACKRTTHHHKISTTTKSLAQITRTSNTTISNNVFSNCGAATSLSIIQDNWGIPTQVLRLSGHALPGPIPHLMTSIPPSMHKVFISGVATFPATKILSG